MHFRGNALVFSVWPGCEQTAADAVWALERLRVVDEKCPLRSAVHFYRSHIGHIK